MQPVDQQRQPVRSTGTIDHPVSSAGDEDVPDVRPSVLRKVLRRLALAEGQVAPGIPRLVRIEPAPEGGAMTDHTMPDPARIGDSFFAEGRFWTLQVGVCPNRDWDHAGPPGDLPDFFEAEFQANWTGVLIGEYRCNICDVPWDGIEWDGTQINVTRGP